MCAGHNRVIMMFKMQKKLGEKRKEGINKEEKQQKRKKRNQKKERMKLL